MTKVQYREEIEAIEQRERFFEHVIHIGPLEHGKRARKDHSNRRSDISPGRPLTLSILITKIRGLIYHP